MPSHTLSASLLCLGSKGKEIGKMLEHIYWYDGESLEIVPEIYLSQSSFKQSSFKKMYLHVVF